MAVEFQDFSLKVKGALDDAVMAYLHEAGGEFVAQTQRNMPTRGTWYSQQKTEWQYEVDKGKGIVTIGNPLEASIWTEFGTGEYALNGNGRKGYWVYVKDGNSDPPRNYVYKGGKTYSLQEAKQIAAMLKADGLDAHITRGQTPKRPFHNAFITLKPWLIKRAGELLKGRLK